MLHERNDERIQDASKGVVPLAGGIPAFAVGKMVQTKEAARFTAKNEVRDSSAPLNQSQSTSVR
jgi:hypothetical protein